MTMSKNRRTAVTQEIRALLAEIEKIPQKRWDELDRAGWRPDDALILPRNFLKSLKSRNEICKGSESPAT